MADDIAVKSIIADDSCPVAPESCKTDLINSRAVTSIKRIAETSWNSRHVTSRHDRK